MKISIRRWSLLASAIFVVSGCSKSNFSFEHLVEGANSTSVDGGSGGASNPGGDGTTPTGGSGGGGGGEDTGVCVLTCKEHKDRQSCDGDGDRDRYSFFGHRHDDDDDPGEDVACRENLAGEDADHQGGHEKVLKFRAKTAYRAGNACVTRTTCETIGALLGAGIRLLHEQSGSTSPVRFARFRAATGGECETEVSDEDFKRECGQRN